MISYYHLFAYSYMVSSNYWYLIIIYLPSVIWFQVIIDTQLWFIYIQLYCPVSLDCRIHWLNLCRVVRLPIECPAYDTKQSNGEIPVMPELWGMWNTASLPLLPSPLWPRVVAPERVLSIGQIKLNCVFQLNWIAWNRTVLTFKLRTYAKLNCLK